MRPVGRLHRVPTRELAGLLPRLDVIRLPAARARTSAALPASRRRASHRSPTTIDEHDERPQQHSRGQRPRQLAAPPALQGGATPTCQPPRGPRSERLPPTAQVPPPSLRAMPSSWSPPPSQELRTRTQAVNDRFTFVIDHHPDLHGRAVTRRSDEHRHREVTCCERSPVVPVRMHQVVVGTPCLLALGSMSNSAIVTSPRPGVNTC